MATSEISDLLARATALLRRAQELADTAVQQSLSNQLTVTTMTVRDAHVELRQILSGLMDVQSAAIEATLETEAAKLDAIEGQLRRTRHSGA